MYVFIDQNGFQVNLYLWQHKLLTAEYSIGHSSFHSQDLLEKKGDVVRENDEMTINSAKFTKCFT